jgi:hypothetical protein
MLISREYIIKILAVNFITAATLSEEKIKPNKSRYLSRDNSLFWVACFSWQANLTVEQHHPEC